MHTISVCVLFPLFKIIFQISFQENALELCYVSMFGKLYWNDSRESLIQDHTDSPAHKYYHKTAPQIFIWFVGDRETIPTHL